MPPMGAPLGGFRRAKHLLGRRNRGAMDPYRLCLASPVEDGQRSEPIFPISRSSMAMRDGEYLDHREFLPTDYCKRETPGRISGCRARQRAQMGESPAT